MTGAELIKWIQAAHAENMEVYIQHANDGQTLPKVNKAECPMLCSLRRDSSTGIIRKVDCNSKRPTEIIIW